MKRILIAGVVSTLLAGAAYAASAPINAAIADAGRPATDTARDANRHPADLMDFASIKPGQQVVDLLPGGGYFTRLFAKTVGTSGHVYALMAKAPNEAFNALVAANPNVSVIQSPLDNFKTPQPVDVIWTSDNYHDVHNKGFATDVAAMNKAIFAALKPGGIYMVIDHRAAKGAGPGATDALHRTDEDIAKQEILAAGFKLAAESKILTNPADDNTKKVFEAGEHDHTDQFVLKFQKPM